MMSPVKDESPLLPAARTYRGADTSSGNNKQLIKPIFNDGGKGFDLDNAY